jgi:hypothetical protein
MKNNTPVMNSNKTAKHLSTGAFENGMPASPHGFECLRKTGHPKVFGADGLPALPDLAFGDFSYDGQFHNHNRLFFRHTWSIRNPENDTLQQSEDELIDTL